MALVWIPLVAVLAGSASSASSVALRPVERRVVAPSTAVQLTAGTSANPAPADGALPPACVGDVCQPRVSVPGYEPRLSSRGRRTELAAHLLARAHIEPLASVAHFLAVTGIRLDFTPAVLDTGLSRGPEGWGHAQLMLRWRIDAFGKPVWAVVR
ncbi:hypothetical protein [Anaeromyxobacter terrae]|uniref:hypothetical protein n=1 Tax=Anaeromyxobacter terrae TaxID=2925406 RepID=UPI001F5A2BB2|nr:hypothetical protein [Anaeromyxobacter sp. SG22]